MKIFTRNNFLKLDGTNNMVGDLDLNNNKITNVVDPTDNGDAVTKQYVDSRKPLITIRAQEIGPLNRGQVEWSFGSGDYTSRYCGYCMPAPGRILRGYLSSIGESGAAGAAGVLIIINGLQRSSVPKYNLSKPDGVYSHTRTYTTPIELAQNDRINFQTILNTSDAINSIVSLLIELDL